MNLLITGQYLYRYAAVTSLANSKLLAITITDKAAPANSLDKPKTEKNAALNATNNAENPSNGIKILDFSNSNLPLLNYTNKYSIYRII